MAITALISGIGVVGLAILLTQLRFENAILFLLVIGFASCAVVLCTSLAVLLSEWKHRTPFVVGLSATAIIVGLLLAYLQIRPTLADEDKGDEPTKSIPTQTTSTPTSSASAPSTAEPSPATTPIRGSEQPTERVDTGTLTLGDAQSGYIESWGLRVAASSVYSSYVDVVMTTDDNVCQAYLDVGESIVLSNRHPGDVDYSRWYAAALERIDAGEATLVWSVGTGRAPAATTWDSCT